MDYTKYIFLIEMAATLYMCGLIWFVQIVHYPLLAAVGKDGFTEYERKHCIYTSFAVIPVMLTELFCAAIWFVIPSWLLPWQYCTGFFLLLIIWGSTFFLQVPQHNKLSQGYNEEAQQELVKTNWWRTAAWSARGILFLYIFWELLGKH